MKICVRQKQSCIQISKNARLCSYPYHRAYCKYTTVRNVGYDNDQRDNKLNFIKHIVLFVAEAHHLHLTCENILLRYFRNPYMVKTKNKSEEQLRQQKKKMKFLFFI